MKPSDKVLELLKRANSEYLNVIETGEDDFIVLNAYLSILKNLSIKYLEYKRKGK